MSGYVLGLDAEFDLDEIWKYIAADSVEAADRWVEKQRPVEIVAVEGSFFIHVL